MALKNRTFIAIMQECEIISNIENNNRYTI